MDEELERSPVCLLVPGLGDSGPSHWQTIWGAERRDCQRVELGCWDDPIRNVWISRIDQAVGAAIAPVMLVAHSLGCLAVAWWASLLGDGATGSVRGALLVAPPDVDRGCADGRLHRFGPSPRKPLPFPAMLVASRNDPYASFERSTEMAGNWLATLIDAGHVGHVNADSGLGAWKEGQRLLETLIDDGATWQRQRAAAMRPALPMGGLRSPVYRHASSPGARDGLAGGKLFFDPSSPSAG